MLLAIVPISNLIIDICIE
uniref:Uncharacterized protein n=1 Tax=Arundo donax TaxID=35708 RepID=A0A0A8ZCJ2_ARUDO